LTTNRLAEIHARARSIQGWIYPEAAEFLYELAKHVAPPVIVEVGSWRGLSTFYLASGALDNAEDAHVYAIDTWLGTPDEAVHQQIIAALGPDGLYQEFLANMKNLGVDNVITPVRSDSVAAAAAFDQKVGLLFLDAGHAYSSVFADFFAWAPKVVPGGYVVFDDVPGWPGPTKLVRQLQAAHIIDTVHEAHNQLVARMPTYESRVHS
jgi:predicted O-methyltransferase YrrM